MLSAVVNVSRSHKWNLDLASDLYIAHDDNNGELKFRVTEIYSIKNLTVMSTFLLRNLGWEVILSEIGRKSHRRKNLRAQEVIGVSEEKAGLVHVSPDGRIVFRGGYNVEEYRYLRDALNYT